MGDVSVDVFTIPMVEFDCLGGAKQLQNGDLKQRQSSSTSKF